MRIWCVKIGTITLNFTKRIKSLHDVRCTKGDTGSERGVNSFQENVDENISIGTDFIEAKH
jgi:hypothetical protein